MDFSHSRSGPAQSWLLDLMLGPVRWQLLRSGFELQVFDYLPEPKTAPELADSLGFKAEKVAVLLDALTSLGFLQKTHGQYRLVESLRPFLISDSPQSMREMLLHLARVKHCDMDDMLNVLKTGESEHVSADFARPEFWDRAVGNLRSFHASCSNRVALQLLKSLPEWGQVRSILDLGAGSENLAVSLAEGHPDLKVRVFDLEPCASRIRSAISSRYSQQITVVAGDYNHDPLPQHSDLIWASMSLYYAKDLELLLTELRDSLNEQGMLVCLHEGLTAERTQPEHHVVGRFVPALNGIDVSFNHGDIAAAMTQAGFTRVLSRGINTLYGPMDLDIGYR
ncbi:methyltransferase [Aliamphritea hakodatensis]|uniref:methyltransferase n=1 Tax=Aliamphritea hakodatensis TaxID=2895352 RepID=UPI0022FD6A4C|nr:methyltransferase [Aliamphritea hakodatensis]